jgi:hypothetical protein
MAYQTLSFKKKLSVSVDSAKKIKAKPPAPFSTLKPETNSDSHSAKSKGVRLV